MDLAETRTFQGTARFELLRLIGSGGMGLVYEALDRTRGVRVALKTMNRVAADDLSRFKNEFRALADVVHPNLVSFGELYEDEGQWFFTMELVQGTDLLTYVRGGGLLASEEPTRTVTGGDESAVSGEISHEVVRRTFDEGLLRGALKQLVAGLGALHGGGKVHRDVKPSNVLVTPEGRVVILDFGLVKDITHDDALTSALSVVGSSSYMSPEQASGGHVGPEADLYAVGVILYQALTGRLPYAGTPLQIMMDKQRRLPPPPSTFAARVPADLDALCMGLLAHEPSARPTGGAILAQLGEPAPERTQTPHLTHAAVFVGRVWELAVLRGALEEVQRGRPNAVVLRGLSGVGKSALMRFFAESVAARIPSAVVLAGRCYEREAVPYKALDGAMAMLERHLRQLDATDAALLVGPDAGLVARLFPALSKVQAVRRATALAVASAPNPREARGRAFAALRGLFERLGAKGPLVVCIDDYQWADADSAALLDELTRPPRAPAMLLLLTMRSDEPTPSGIPDDARCIELAGLSADEGRELVQTLSAKLAPELAADAAQLVREADGHPLFLHELVLHAAETGITGGVLRLDDVLYTRIQRLEEPARHLLEVLAVAGAPLPPMIAAQAAGLDGEQVSRVISLLRVVLFLRSSGHGGEARVEVYHDRVRETVVARLDKDTKRAWHSRIADALEGASAELLDPRALVSHLEHAGEAGRAAKHAERAARLAVDALAFDQAAEFLEIALRLGTHEQDQRRRLHVERGDALVNAGRCADGADAYLRAVDGADAASRLEFRRRAGEQLLVSGHVERGLDEIRGVLDEAGLALPKSPLWTLLSLLFYRFVLRVRGLRWRTVDSSRIAPHRLERLEVHKALGLGLSLVDTVRGSLFQARGLLLALHTGEKTHVARMLGTEAVYRAAEGPRRSARVAALLAELQRIADTSGDSFLQAWAVGTSGCADYLLGHFERSAEKTLIADRLLRAQPGARTWELNHGHIFRCYAIRARGALRELGEAVDDYVLDARRRGDRFAGTTIGRAMSIVWLARGDPDKARAELDATSWSAPETGFLHLQHWYLLRAQVELALYEGDVDGVRTRFRGAIEALDRSLLLRIQTVRTEYHWLLGRLALAENGPTAQRVALRFARGLEREQVGYAFGWAGLLRAAVVAQRGDREGAIALLGRTIASAARADTLLVEAIARRRFGLLRGGPEGEKQVRQAEAWMANEAIASPARMSEVFAPGFREPGVALTPVLTAPRDRGR